MENSLLGRCQNVFKMLFSKISFFGNYHLWNITSQSAFIIFFQNFWNFMGHLDTDPSWPGSVSHRWPAQVTHKDSDLWTALETCMSNSLNLLDTDIAIHAPNGCVIEDDYGVPLIALVHHIFGDLEKNINVSCWTEVVYEFILNSLTPLHRIPPLQPCTSSLIP